MRTESESGLFALSADGRTRRLLLATPTEGGAYGTPAVSPRGDLVAFVSPDETISMARLGRDATLTGPPRVLTEGVGWVLGMAWTADGAAVVYGQGQVGYNPSQLWRLDVSGNARPERIDVAGVGSFPTIAGPKNRLVFSRRFFDMNILALEEGQPPRPIAASTLADYDPQFSPDGRRIAFVTDRSGRGSEIWTANADGSGLVSLTRGEHAPEGGPSWSPDGRQIAYDGFGADGRPHVYVIDAAGGPSRELAAGPFADYIPNWSRDGRWIYFGSDRTGRLETWRAPVTEGPAVQVTHNGGIDARESWDAATLYFRKTLGAVMGPSRLFQMPVEGGPERELWPVPYWNFWPVDDGVYYVAVPTETQPPYTYEVRFHDDATDTSRVVHSIQLESIGPKMSVSPDGMTVLISGVRAGAVGMDLMLIENFR